MNTQLWSKKGKLRKKVFWGTIMDIHSSGLPRQGVRDDCRWMLWRTFAWEQPWSSQVTTAAPPRRSLYRSSFESYFHFSAWRSSVLCRRKIFLKRWADVWRAGWRIWGLVIHLLTRWTFLMKTTIISNVDKLDQEKTPQINVKKCELKYENQINFGPLAALERCEAFLLFLKKMLESGG